MKLLCYSFSAIDAGISYFYIGDDWKFGIFITAAVIFLLLGLAVEE